MPLDIAQITAHQEALKALDTLNQTRPVAPIHAEAPKQASSLSMKDGNPVITLKLQTKSTVATATVPESQPYPEGAKILTDWRSLMKSTRAEINYAYDAAAQMKAQQVALAHKKYSDWPVLDWFLHQWHTWYPTEEQKILTTNIQTQLAKADQNFALITARIGKIVHDSYEIALDYNPPARAEDNRLADEIDRNEKLEINIKSFYHIVHGSVEGLNTTASMANHAAWAIEDAAHKLHEAQRLRAAVPPRPWCSEYTTETRTRSVYDGDGHYRTEIYNETVPDYPCMARWSAYRSADSAADSAESSARSAESEARTSVSNTQSLAADATNKLKAADIALQQVANPVENLDMTLKLALPGVIDIRQNYIPGSIVFRWKPWRQPGVLRGIAADMGGKAQAIQARWVQPIAGDKQILRTRIEALYVDRQEKRDVARDAHFTNKDPTLKHVVDAATNWPKQKPKLPGIRHTL